MKGRGGEETFQRKQSLFRRCYVETERAKRIITSTVSAAQRQTLNYRRNADVFHGVNHMSNTSRPTEINHTPCSDTHTPLMNTLEKKDRLAAHSNTAWTDFVRLQVAEGVRCVADLAGLILNRLCVCVCVPCSPRR